LCIKKQATDGLEGVKMRIAHSCAFNFLTSFYNLLEILKIFG